MFKIEYHLETGLWGQTGPGMLFVHFYYGSKKKLHQKYNMYTIREYNSFKCELRGFPRVEYSGAAPHYLCSFPFDVVSGM